METVGHQPHSGPSPAVVDVSNGCSKIAKFYEDQVVFITGGTGFLGKVLLEKLLRSCHGVKRVYLFVRNKRGEEPEARIQGMLNSKVFDRLKQERPGALGKVKVVAGDLIQQNLGLSASDQASLIAEVTIVLHSAANVKVYEPFKRAVQINVVGTRRVLELCKKMPNLKALVHVSTAFCNCHEPEVDEVVYPPPADPSKVIEATEWMDDKMMDMMKGWLLERYPTTYTLTKALGESLLLAERERLPVAIVRPSIVTASWKEPFPGWVDNYYHCTGIIVSCGLGLQKSIIAEKDCIADIIPVDVVANTLISVAWHLATARPEHVMVYHCTSGSFQKHTWADVTGRIQEIIVRHPLPNLMRFPKIFVPSSPLRHNLILYSLNYLPACVGDLALRLTGRKPRYVPLYRKVRRAMDAVQYFTTHGWLFRSNNMVELLDALSPTDKQLFNLEVRNLPWLMYWDQYMLGIREHLLNADASSLPQARKRLKYIYTANLFLNVLLATFAWRVLMARSQIARNLCYSTLAFAQKPWKVLSMLRSLPWRR